MTHGQVPCSLLPPSGSDDDGSSNGTGTCSNGPFRPWIPTNYQLLVCGGIAVTAAVGAYYAKRIATDISSSMEASRQSAASANKAAEAAIQAAHAAFKAVESVSKVSPVRSEDIPKLPTVVDLPAVAAGAVAGIVAYGFSKIFGGN